MITVGITGGIGSGKTIICKVFAQLGIPVFDADTEARKLYNLPQVADEVKKKFGAEYYSSGKLNTGKFAALIFGNAQALAWVNAMIHPIVRKQFKEWKRKFKQAPYVLKEAAILFESGADSGCDKIITVAAPVSLRAARTMDRDNRNRAQVDQIMQRQWSDEKRIEHSDFVIVNDETKPVLPQVLAVHAELLAIAGA